MNSIYDRSITDKLGFLRDNHRKAYRNFTRVLNCAYAAYLCEHAEHSFNAGHTNGYACYGVLVDYEKEFSAYLKMPYHGDSLYYLFVREDYRYAAIYAVGPENQIKERQHLYLEMEIKEALATFEPYLAQCGPGDIVCSIDPATNQTTILKGRVYHAVQL